MCTFFGTLCISNAGATDEHCRSKARLLYLRMDTKVLYRRTCRVFANEEEMGWYIKIRPFQEYRIQMV